MTKASYLNLQIAAIPDEKNPAFVFSTINNEMLAKIASGEIDAQALARLTLAGRCYNADGITWNPNALDAIS